MGGLSFYEDASGNKYVVGADTVPKKLGSGNIVSGTANTYKYWHGPNTSSGNSYLKVNEKLDFSGSGILIVIPPTSTNVTMLVTINGSKVTEEKASVIENYPSFGTLFVLDEIKVGDALFIETNSDKTPYGYARIVLYCFATP